MKLPGTFMQAAFLGCVMAAIPVWGAQVDLRMDRIEGPLRLLSSEDRSAVDQAVGLIRKGMNTAALARLSTLTKENPENSSLRILTAYALLQAGNLLGAFDEARRAESLPNGNSYKCWLLARIALLVGDHSVCKRELKHVKKAGDMADDVKALEAGLLTSN